MAKRLAGTVTAVGISVLSAAALGAFGHKAGSESWTEPSGKAGASYRDVVTTADYFGLQSIKAWEYARRTCVLEIEEEALVTRDKSRLDALKICEPTVGQVWKEAALGSGEFLTSISVCTGTNKDEPAVHGLQLTGAVIEPDGTLKAAKASVRLEFPDCKKWQAPRACPKGAIATGVRAYFDDDEHGLVGVALRCHALEQRGK